MSGRLLALFAGGPGFVKDARSDAVVDEGGVRGDRHHGRAADRALLLVPAASYLALADDGLAVPFGSLGENLVADGLPAEGLAPGSELRIGSVRAVVTQPCTVCRALAEVHPRLPKLAYGRRGVYLRVRDGGTLRPGAPVHIVTDVSRSIPWLPHDGSPRSVHDPSPDAIAEEAHR